MSDHRALRFTFTIMNNIRGDGYWKLNSSYLDNDDFKAGIKQICTVWKILMLLISGKYLR